MQPEGTAEEGVAQPSGKSGVWGQLHGILGSSGGAPSFAPAAAAASLASILDDGQPGATHISPELQERPLSALLAVADGLAPEASQGQSAGQHHLPGFGFGAGDESPTGLTTDKSYDWKSFIQNWEDDGTRAPEKSMVSMRSTKSARGKGVSLVEELEQQTADAALAELAMQQGSGSPGGVMDPSKRPKKSALKTGGGRADDSAEGSFQAGKGALSVQDQLQANFEIKLPSLDTGPWEAIVHQIVWKMGRHFGFQAFNMNPKTKDLSMSEYVPGSIFCASDHLNSLLCKYGYIRRGKQENETDEERFAKAVMELHTTIFYSYEHHWTKLVNLSWRAKPAQEVLETHGFADSRAVHGLLCELALWFLIYTEGSNMRHTPELLWFIYWCMSHSFVMADFWHRELPEADLNAREKRVELRNLHQQLIRDIQVQLQIYPTRVRPEDCGRISSIVARIAEVSDVPEEDFALLGDLVAFGDGGFFCDRIVTPIFDVIAYEVDHMSNLGVDVCHRLGYDDINESMCVPQIVHDTLAELRVRPEQLAQATMNDSYVALTNLGFNKLHSMGGFQPGIASEFWHTKVFVKTYRERRTWAAVYRNFFRVWCVHFVAYQFLQVLAFTGWDWRFLSSCIVTHSWMKAFERICNWFMTSESAEPLNTTLSKVFTSQGRYRMSKAGLRAVQRMNKVMGQQPAVARSAVDFMSGRSPTVKRRKHIIEGHPLYGFFGLWEWILLALLIMVWYLLQFYESPIYVHARDWWAVFSAAYVALHALHWCLTLRDGFMVSLTHMLRMPSIFRASSPRGEATCWLEAPMHMKWKLLFLNGLFWFTVFAMKLPFDYFVIAQPVVIPLKVVVTRNWLECEGKWYKYPFPCIGGDWLLLAGRVCPFLVIIFMDTSLFYQITITIFGIFRGLFKLDLGVLTSWDEVVTEFYRAPARWWWKCMSQMGNDNQLSQLKQSMFIEDNATGGVTQVSDGLMFKKAVLTPEEIAGKKVHFNGRGRGTASTNGAASEVASRAQSTTSNGGGILERMGQAVSAAARGGGSREGGKKGALLPSAVNRTAQRHNEIHKKQHEEEARKREERRKEDEAKAAQRKAALAAGRDLNAALNGVGDSGGDKGKEEEEEKKPAGIKGMFNRVMGKAEEDDVDKLTAATQKIKKSVAAVKAGGAGAPNLRGKKVELSVAQAPKKKTKPSASAASSAATSAADEGSEEDEDDDDGESSEDDESTPVGGRPQTARHGSKPDAGSAPANPTSMFSKLISRQQRQQDEVDRMAAGARQLAAKQKAAVTARPMSASPHISPSNSRPGSAYGGGPLPSRLSDMGRGSDSGKPPSQSGAASQGAAAAGGKGKGKPKKKINIVAPEPGPPPSMPPALVPAEHSGGEIQAEGSGGLSEREAGRISWPRLSGDPGPSQPQGIRSLSPRTTPPGPVGEGQEQAQQQQQQQWGEDSWEAAEEGRGMAYVTPEEVEMEEAEEEEEGVDTHDSDGLSDVSSTVSGADDILHHGFDEGVPTSSAAAELAAAARQADEEQGLAHVAAAHAGVAASSSNIVAGARGGKPEIEAVHPVFQSKVGPHNLWRGGSISSSLGSFSWMGSARSPAPEQQPALPQKQAKKKKAPVPPAKSLAMDVGPATLFFGQIFREQALQELMQEEEEEAARAAAEADSSACGSVSEYGTQSHTSWPVQGASSVTAESEEQGCDGSVYGGASPSGEQDGQVRICMGPLMAGPVPVAEANEGEGGLTSWLVATAAGTNGNAPAPVRVSGTGLGPLPPIQTSPRTSVGGIAPPPQKSRKPLESELDDLFGKPIDARGNSFMAAGQAPLPHRPMAAARESTNSLPPISTQRPRAVSLGMQGPGAGGNASPKKSARFADAGASDDGHSTFGGKSARSDSATSGVSKFKDLHRLTTDDWDSSPQKSGKSVADDEPLIGRFKSVFNLWKKKDSENGRVQRSQPSVAAKRMKSMTLLNAQKPGASGPGSMKDGSGPDPSGGLTIDDLAIDDVHYQMMMWNAFALAWDEIVSDVRGADLISDKEVLMLQFVRLDLGSRHYGLRPILLPTFFYAGQVRKVVDTGTVATAQIMVLNELRMLCTWVGCQIGLLSGKHAHVITSAPFYGTNVNVKHALHRKNFFRAGVKIVDFLEDMCSRQEVPFEMKEFAEHLYTLLTSLEGECFAIMKAHERGRATDDDLELSSIMLEVVQEMKREISKDPDQLKVIFKNALSTSATATYKELLRVVRVIKRMLLATVAEATPQSEEAQRCLGFFINSLGHPHLDRPTSLDKMWSWSILTPLYEEDVLYALEGGRLAKELGLKKKKMTDLLSEGDDSVTLMSYLKATFPEEWSNFKERMKSLVPDIDVKDLSEIDFAPNAWLYEYRMELQLWASCRGQLLGRTVTGMMRNEKALRVLAKLEHPMPPTMSDLEYQRWVDTLVQSRFEMVVTPQTYGKNRDSNDVRLRWLAKSIDLLLQRYPKCFKAAYLEKAEVDGMGLTEYSVCIRGRDPNDINELPNIEEQPVYEIYRIRHPTNKYSTRGVILGEGKPENQNHATIFAHHEGIQAIDMNQDGYLCEWLKFRNLLAELQPSTRGDAYLFCDSDETFQITTDLTAAQLHSVVRSRQVASVPTALVGFREYIFSEAAGALGRFAAATEYAFGTISQRTLTHPARVRLHYGHPDLFNKLFVMTRGNISKATRVLHLTEDVFCGCNHTLRGARIRYKEYISCGKGRDMGFDSINGFNFKIAGGGGEWAMSRESYRLGTRFDFFRMMAYYHAGVGFYINSWFTFLAVYLNVYALLLFAWAQATEIQAGGIQRVYNVQQVLQLGTLALIPYAGQLMLENGVVSTCLTLFQQIATGSLLFYTFQQQTVASSFAYDMKYGSGKYVGTGRGFNLVSLEFVKIFTLYCRSHLYMAFEILYALSTLYIVRDCTECNYGALTWSSWLLAVTLLFSPLWFNPFSFEMAKVSNNFLVWKRWMNGDVDATTGSNWYTWNNVQLEKIRNDGGNNTDTWLNHLGSLVSTTPYLLMALGASSRLNVCIETGYTARHPALCNTYVIFSMATVTIWMFVHLTIVLRHHWLELANHKPWRLYRWGMVLGVVIFLVLFLVLVQRFLRGRAFDVLALVLYANFNLLIAFHKLVTPIFSQNNGMRAFSDWFFYTVDSLIGYLMFILMAFLSFIGVVSVLQMKLLFNDSFSENVKHAKIGRAMREQKIGVVAQAAPAGAVAGSQALTSARPSTAASAATGITVQTMVMSERRYM